MASIENLRASDGTGNANMATVQSTRAPAATTIIVDTVLGINPDGFSGSMGTPHTFTDPITSETITVISDATAVDFTGHVDGSNLEIDDIAPGYTDAGSQVGDIVIIKPTTQYADNLADVLDAAHNDDGTIKDNAVDAGTIADNAIDDVALFTDSVDPVKRDSEMIYDYVVPGGVVLAGSAYGSGLGWTLSAGVVYIAGKRLTYAGGSGNVTASKDTYFDLLDNGDGTAVLVNTGGNVVNNNVASPSLAASSVRVGIIQSGANIASVAAVNQGQLNKLLPIASSVAYTKTDSLGNIICPRDPARKLLGYKEIQTPQAGVTSEVDATGLAAPVIVPTGRDIKITTNGNFDTSAADTYPHAAIKESTTYLGGKSGITATGAAGFRYLPVEANISPTAGLHTYKLAFQRSSGTGTVSLVAAAPAANTNGPVFIKIELEQTMYSWLTPVMAEAGSSPTDPASYYFTQGVLGITVIVLALVIRFLFSYYTKKIDEKDTEIRALNQARFDDNKTHTADYREMAKNDQLVLSGNSQANELLAGKIEAVRGRH